jgi:hypothetical protein
MSADTIAAGPDHDPAAWRAFLDEPAATVDRGRLAGLFGGAIDEEAAGRLAASERLRRRLSDLILAHHGLATASPAEATAAADRRVALASAERLAEIARRAGAIYWAAAIARAVKGPVAAALRAELGEAATFALANRAHAGPAQSLEPLEGVAARIVEDGWRCLGAWCRAQPADVGVRVRLKLAARPALDDPPPPAFAERGPAIVRVAAE